MHRGRGEGGEGACIGEEGREGKGCVQGEGEDREGLHSILAKWLHLVGSKASLVGIVRYPTH